MKKLSLSLIAILATSPLLMQCASQDDLTLIHQQLRQMDKQITQLETICAKEISAHSNNAASIRKK